MASATVAEEEYLQILFWLQEAKLPMTGANVARAMQLSAPTVHEMVGRLERDGYITRAADKAIAFTDNGREHAENVVRRHRLIERFLTDILEIPWDEVHEEAERLEPGREGVIAESDDESVSVDFEGTTATLTRSVAETVSVRADPSPPART